MKRLCLLLLLPLIVATTCEDDDLNSGFETEYFIQNDSSIDFILFPKGNSQIIIESGSDFLLASQLNQETNPIIPSKNFAFNSVKLFKVENDNFILVYKQDPIDDALWVFNEPTTNRYNYKLIITDDLIDD